MTRAWEQQKVRWRATKIGSGKTPSGGADAYVSSGVTFIRSQNVYDDGLRLDDVVFIDGETHHEMSGTALQSGDVLLNITGASLGRVTFVPPDFGTGNVNQHVCIIRPDDRTSPRFLAYALQSTPVRQQILSGEQGSSREGLNFGQVGNLRADFPGSREEEDAIAHFLDRKTAAIDALIAKKERLIELLEEKRQALITQAVTKGLDPTVPMKDSGIEWLGPIPAHWRVARIKFVAKLESGHTPNKETPDYWAQDGADGIPWVSLNDTKALASSDYISETAYRITEAGIANSSARMLPAGVVVFTRDATVGLAAITTVPATVSQHVIAWVCGADLMPEYLLYVFYAMREELDRRTMGATVKTIGLNDVKALATPLPPRALQARIVDHVRSELDQLRRIEGAVEVQLERLREYRQALITAAVTGKIDVTRPTPGALDDA